MPSSAGAGDAAGPAWAVSVPGFGGSMQSSPTERSPSIHTPGKHFAGPVHSGTRRVPRSEETVTQRAVHAEARNRRDASSSTRQVRRPVAYAPVSMPIRLRWTSGAIGHRMAVHDDLAVVAPITDEFVRIHSKSCSCWSCSGIPGRTPRVHENVVPFDVAERELFEEHPVFGRKDAHELFVYLGQQGQRFSARAAPRRRSSAGSPVRLRRTTPGRRRYRRGRQAARHHGFP